VLVEDPQMAGRRAAKIAGILEGLGIDRDRIEIRSVNAAAGGTGQEDWRSRRVVLRVTPLKTN
jgi:outer membrane protein OmpA-like peptidoglycan-associated protein